jgi:hypothetical protein
MMEWMRVLVVEGYLVVVLVMGYALVLVLVIDYLMVVVSDGYCLIRLSYATSL